MKAIIYYTYITPAYRLLTKITQDTLYRNYLERITRKRICCSWQSHPCSICNPWDWCQTRDRIPWWCRRWAHPCDFQRLRGERTCGRKCWL